ncbi:hypothetical protein QC762_405618 [Podospora pseudocomata]|uniref:MARVEL domain-containing protein n=1 Tax=Podospora pseudocomata TaxID=2093779 RepID=A0ABR0GH99_9PEZI|nr:hypothetical protein QC762_405618 [Podospora pseudocomata]
MPTATTTLHLPSAEALTAAACYLLRLTQFSSLSISCFSVCYLIWMHSHHFCAYWSCNDPGQEAALVPLGEVIYVVSCVLIALEWIYTTSSSLLTLSNGKRPDVFTQLCSTWMSVMILAIGLGILTSISTVRQTWPFCNGTGVTRFSSHYPPEINSCIVTQSAVTTGLITMVCSLLLAMLAVWETKKDLRTGRIRLPFSIGQDEERVGGHEGVMGSDNEEGVPISE